MRIGLFAVNVCMPSAGFRRAGNPMSVTDPRLTIFDTNRGNGAEWWVSVLFFSFPYSHFPNWTKLTTSQFVRSQNIFTHRDVYASNSSTEFPLYGFQTNLESDWALWATCLSGIFQSWSEQSKRKVHDLNLEKILFTSWSGVSLSKVLYEQLESWFVYWKLLFECREPVECMNVEFARYAVMFSHSFQICWRALLRAVRNPAERSGWTLPAAN